MTDIDNLVNEVRADGSFVCTEEYMKDVFNNLVDRVKTVNMLTSGTTSTIDGSTMFKIYLPIMLYTLQKYQPSIEPKSLADELVKFINFKIDEEDNTYEIVIPYEMETTDFTDSDDIEAEILAFVATEFHKYVIIL